MSQTVVLEFTTALFPGVGGSGVGGSGMSWETLESLPSWIRGHREEDDMKSTIQIEDLFKLRQKKAHKGTIMGHHGKAGRYSLLLNPGQHLPVHV